MGWFEAARSVARALFRRGAEERDLADEIDFHLEMEAEKLVRQGWDPREARRQARLRFGGVDRMKERARDERGTRWLEDAWSDLRYAARTLRRSPTFTVTAVLTLGLGIGATTAAFTLVDGVLLRPLPYADPSNLVELRELGDGRRFFPSFPNFQDWRRESRALDGIVAVRPPMGPIPLLGAGEPTVVSAVGVTRDFLSVLGVPPFLGRDFTIDENAVGGPNVAMVSHGLWTTRLGADPELERLSFTVFGESYRVVGVLPPGFRFLYDADVYYPDERWPNTVRSSHAHRVVGRLTNGVTLVDAKSDLDRLAADIQAAYPGESQAETVEVRRLADALLGGHRRPLGLLLGASALVLLLACANVASTMTAPAREVGSEARFDNYTGWRLVDRGYFDALGIRLVRGRLLQPTDLQAGLVNESLARLLWQDEDPIGKRIVSNFDQEAPVEVVGVVADARDWRWQAGAQTEIYVPWWSRAEHIQGPLRFMIRTSSEDPGALVPAVRERLRAVHPSLPAEFETLRSALTESVADRRFVVAVLLAFAGTGLVLALVGVFGVVAYTVERRRREIGIRIALGAETGRVRREVRTRALRAVGLGVVVGAVGALAGSGLVEALLYEVDARDPLTLASVAVLFLATAALASELPARRASRVAPASVLKE